MIQLKKETNINKETTEISYSKKTTVDRLRPGLIRKYFRNDGVTSVIWGYTLSFMRIFPLSVCDF